jgi:hypothetical protein
MNNFLAFRKSFRVKLKHQDYIILKNNNFPFSERPTIEPGIWISKPSHLRGRSPATLPHRIARRWVADAQMERVMPENICRCIGGRSADDLAGRGRPGP